MPTEVSDNTLEDRLVAVEREWADGKARLARLEAAAIDARLLVPLNSPRTFAGHPTVQRHPMVQSVPAPPAPRPSAPSPSARRARTASATTITDAIGGRGLAWLGGGAMLLGIVLLLALAISRGWIGQDARVLLAAAASTLLVAGGVWLRSVSGRTEAAVAMVGAGTAGMFATLVVGSSIYGLVAAAVALAVGLFTGGVAALLAIRWAGQAIGAIGLLGAVLTPWLVGAPDGGITIAFLILATAASMVVVVGRRWGWLGFGAVLLAEPQFAIWLTGWNAVSRPGSEALAALVAFAALGLAGAAGLQSRAIHDRVQPSAAALLVLSATILAVAGRAGLVYIAGSTVASSWLVALAVGHCGIAALGRRLPRVRPLRPVAFVIAAALADAAFALSFHGVVLSLGWGIAATAFAFMAARRPVGATGGTRRLRPLPGDELVAQLGLGAHIALILLHTLLAVPPGVLGSGDATSTALTAVAALAAACIGSARLTQPTHAGWRIALDGLGLLAIAYLTAIAFDGPLLVATWSAEAVALGVLAHRHRDPVAWLSAAGFLSLAAAHALLVEAPPSALVVGVPSLPAAAVGLAALALACIGLSHSVRAAGGNLGSVGGVPVDMARLGLAVGAVAALIYLASVAIIDIFQPAAGTGIALLDLGVRQQGQVLLSVLWSVTGVSVLLVGLRHRIARLRTGALAGLLLVTAKVFLYDLSTLTSIYRVASFIVLGVVLLAAGFAYGKLRPTGADRIPMT